jgi:hypothetical protein
VVVRLGRPHEGVGAEIVVPVEQRLGAHAGFPARPQPAFDEIAAGSDGRLQRIERAEMAAFVGIEVEVVVHIDVVPAHFSPSDFAR